MYVPKFVKSQGSLEVVISMHVKTQAALRGSSTWLKIKAKTLLAKPVGPSHSKVGKTQIEINNDWPHLFAIFLLCWLQ